MKSHQAVNVPAFSPRLVCMNNKRRLNSGKCGMYFFRKCAKAAGSFSNSPTEVTISAHLLSSPFLKGEMECPFLGKGAKTGVLALRTMMTLKYGIDLSNIYSPFF